MNTPVDQPIVSVQPDRPVKPVMMTRVIDPNAACIRKLDFDAVEPQALADALADALLALPLAVPNVPEVPDVVDAPAPP